MKIEPFSVTLTDQLLCQPQEILFCSFFNFKNASEEQEKSALVHQNWVSFLEKAEVKIIEGNTFDMTNNGFTYSITSYQFSLNQATYRQVEEYQNSYPEVRLFALEMHYSRNDEDILLDQITEQAQKMAFQWISQAKIETLEKLQVIKIEEDLKGWRIGPPLDVRFDHFNVPLKATYQFSFKEKG